MHIHLLSSCRFYAEATKLKQLQHAHIVRVYGLCTTDDPIFIVFEYMNEGSLNSYLQSRKGGMNESLSADVFERVWVECRGWEWL